MSGAGVCLVRFHDGSAKPNWGGRATSLALGRVVGWSGRQVASVVTGDVIVNGLGLDPRWRRAVIAAGRLGRRARLPLPTRRTYTPEEWASVEALAAEVAVRPPSPRAAQVVEALAAADEVWVNGEGDLILADRPTLYRTLLLTHLAVALGKPVRMANSILSEPVGRPPVPHVAAAVGRALAGCAAVTYRDPASLRLHRDLYPDVDASWLPDALFAWAGDAAALAGAQEGFGPASEGLPVATQAWLGSTRPYVALSGTSAVVDRARARAGLADLARALQARSVTPVVVATDRADAWMVEVAEGLGVPWVGAAVPLGTGMRVLAGAACFVSGRYHPSIMASDAGTPCALMGSNSHKTSSLQEVLGSAEPVELPFFGEAATDQLVDATLVAMAQDRAAVAARATELAARLRSA